MCGSDPCNETLEFKLKEYGMFSLNGNLLVQTLVETAKRNKFTWSQTIAVMCLIQQANFDEYGEIMDTAVREAVFDEVGFEENFYP